MSDIPGTGRNVVYKANRNAVREVLGLAAPLVQSAGKAAYKRATSSSGLVADGAQFQLTDLWYTTTSKRKVFGTPGGRPTIRLYGWGKYPAQQRKVEMALMLGLTVSP